MRLAISITLIILLRTTATAEPAIVDLREQQVIAATVTAKPAELETALTRAYMTLVAATMEHGLVIDGPPIARYRSPGESAKDKPITVEAGLVVRGKLPDKLGRGITRITLPAGPAAMLEHRGKRMLLPRAHAELRAWLKARDRATAGIAWEVYVTTPLTTPDPDAQQTTIYVPLRAN